jgi:DNA-binding CsgD family transcriptional regulator
MWVPSSALSQGGVAPPWLGAVTLVWGLLYVMLHMLNQGLKMQRALTKRQQQVAALIAQGLTNEEIGQRLTITPGTVANHIEQMLIRVGARNRAHLAALTVATGVWVPKVVFLRSRATPRPRAASGQA